MKKTKSIKKSIMLLAVGGMLLLPLAANAATLKVEKFSMPIKIPNKVSQPINLTFSADSNWKIIAEPLDSQIRNLDNPNYSLPINRLEIAEMNGTPLAHFDTNKVCEIRNGSMLGINNLNLALNVTNFDSDHPGSYVTDVKFTLINNNTVVAEDVYSFRFMQDTISSIDFTKRVVNMSLEKEKILQKNSSQNLAIPLGVYVCSNKNWKLYVRNPDASQSKQLKYFVKALNSADQNISYNQAGDYVPLLDAPILLATGKSTINSLANNLEKKLLNIDYMVKGPEDKFIPAGSTTEEFEYRLETED